MLCVPKLSSGLTRWQIQLASAAMIALIRLLLALLASSLRSKAALEAENAALRQQIVVLRRKLRGRIMLSNGDRLFFVWLYRLFPSILRAILIIRPDTLVRWHRSGFRRYWRWKSRLRLGRPPIERELRTLIRQMSVENPLWGAPRIHGELLKLGLTVARSTVAKYMVKRRGHHRRLGVPSCVTMLQMSLPSTSSSFRRLASGCCTVSLSIGSPGATSYGPTLRPTRRPNGLRGS